MKHCRTSYHNQSAGESFIIFLQITGLTLEGSTSSYAQFAKWFTGTNSSLELEFRTRQSDGLLLYLDDGGYYDFLQLKLVSGRLRCRFNFGGGAETLAIGQDSTMVSGTSWRSPYSGRRSAWLWITWGSQRASKTKAMISCWETSP